MKNKDIYRWRYNQKRLDQMNDKNNTGTTYWCCSCIGVWNEERQILEDTYWGSGGNKCFNKKEIKEWLELKYIGNLNNLRPCNKAEFNNYNDNDCINISHANAPSSGFYIKKNAKPSLIKKRKVIKKHIEHYRHEIDYYEYKIKELEEDLKNLTIDSYVPCDPDVYIIHIDNRG